MFQLQQKEVEASDKELLQQLPVLSIIYTACEEHTPSLIYFTDAVYTSKSIQYYASGIVVLLPQ